MKLKQLEMILQKAAGYTKPRPSLEQYMTPAPLAARLLYHALMKGDIEGKCVCDLGSGTGVLAIGAALLGAESVKGVEKDPNAVVVAQENAALFGAEVEFIVADIQDKTLPGKIGNCDTVIMNPPFGAQKIHADRPFIDLAITIAPVVYSIFNAGSTPFVKAFIRKRAEVAEQVGSAFAIKRTFAFHTRDVLEFEVEILRLIRKQ
ncbi:MAG: METTL5 family protein [Methanoregula sp.]|nr:METTL5 family protein [Methanoregula sp.]